MKKIYFISDIHLAFKLTEAEQKKREKLLSFLDFITNDAKELYILGDLFDFWFEWYHVIPKYWFSIIIHIQQMIKKGITINLIKGNHDFYLGKFLKEEIGINCYGESREFIEAKKHFFVAHGDGFAKKDWAYRVLKRTIRNPVSIFLYKTFISADVGVQVAKWTSYSSRQLASRKKEAWKQEYYRFAKKKFTQGFDYVILGHLHAPQIRKENHNIYINCGDWISAFSYAVFDGQHLTLNHWNK